MRNRTLVSMIAGAALSVAFASGASAGGWGWGGGWGCGCNSGWNVPIFAAQPVYAPVGYVVEQPVLRSQIYLVNQGPVYSGPPIGWVEPRIAVTGFDYARPYPFIGGSRWGYRRSVYAPSRWYGRRSYRGSYGMRTAYRTGVRPASHYTSRRFAPPPHAAPMPLR
jgi:hypothetical protein